MIQIVMHPSTLLVGGTNPVELMVIYALAETVTASNDARQIRVTLSAQSPDQPSYAYTADVAVVDHAGLQTVQIVAGELSLRNGESYWLTVQLMVGNSVLAMDVKRSILAGTNSPTQTSLVPTMAPSMAPSMPPTIEAVDSAMIVPVTIGLEEDIYLVQTDEGLTIVGDAGFVQPTDPVANVLEEAATKEGSKSNNSLATVIMPVAITVVGLALASWFVVIIALGVFSLRRKRRIAQKSDSFDGYVEHFTSLTSF